jgi:hypothetical protein
MGKALTTSASESPKTTRPVPTDKDPICQFPNERRVTNEDDLMEAAQTHGVAQHPYVFLGLAESRASAVSHPGTGFVSNALTLPHVVDGNA